MDTSARASSSSPLSISTIGEDLTITGNVTSKGELHLNGQVHGDVHCVALVLGENAQLVGNVVAEDVMVRGRLIGTVRALRVLLQATAHVEGDLFHKSLSIEQGTHFEGEFASLGGSTISSRNSRGRTTARPQRTRSRETARTSERLHQVTPRVTQCLGMFLIA